MDNMMNKRKEVERKQEISRVLHDAYYKHIDNKKVDMNAVFKDMVEDMYSLSSITNGIKSNDNPFCNNCKENDCEVSHDETCNMIRKYLSIRVKCFDGWIYPNW